MVDVTREFTEEIPEDLFDEFEDDDEDEYDEGPSRNWGVIILITVLACVCLILGGIVGYRWLKNSSYNKLQKETKITINNENPVTIEAGHEFTYTPTGDKNMDVIPDELRQYVLSYPEDGTVSVTLPDVYRTGQYEAVFSVKREDKFHQTSQDYKVLLVDIKDTISPAIVISSSRVEMNGNSDALRRNVERVTDPVFGEYSYSESGNPGSWKIDTSRISWNKSGTYPVSVVVNDNGTYFTKDFDVVYKPADNYVPVYEYYSPSTPTTVRPQSIEEVKNEAEECIKSGGVWTDEGCKSHQNND